MSTTRKSPFLWIVLGAIVLIGIWIFSGYNGLVVQNENVDTAWAQVESQYQRRLDLIPNLVNTVKGAADFEQSTFTAVTEARTKYMNAPTQEARVEAANEFESSLSRLLVTVEAYPQLQATQAFKDLMVQLEGTENRVNTARTDYNEAVRTYNVTVKRFPTVIVASLFGYDAKPFFESDDGAENAPTVDFDQ